MHCVILCWDEAVYYGIVDGVVLTRKGTQL